MKNSGNRRLPDLLATRLQRELPGVDAQRQFEAELNFGRHAGPPPHDARAAAVVVLLYPERSGPQLGTWKIILTQRPGNLPHHGGQICLPGGMVEQDESLRQAALRELEEELGVAESQVTVLGRLSPLYVWVSNFWVTPWVAWCEEEPLWRPSPDEVTALVALPLADLLDDRCLGRIQQRRRGLQFTAPCIESGGHRIWGATSMILGELKSLLLETEIAWDAEMPQAKNLILPGSSSCL
ncbi:MAG: CoA pyrophosphatase [Pirellulales bacterium]